MKPFEPVAGPAVWYAEDMLERSEEWTLRLNEEHISELEAAVAAAQATGKEIHVRPSV